jgi:hypothetical protein
LLIRPEPEAEWKGLTAGKQSCHGSHTLTIACQHPHGNTVTSRVGGEFGLGASVNGPMTALPQTDAREWEVRVSQSTSRGGRPLRFSHWVDGELFLGA